MRCRNGYNQIGMHDGINKWTFEEQKGDMVMEIEPQVKNSDGSRKRPDVIWHSKIDYKGIQTKVIMDTIIGNIFNINNLKNIEKGKYKIFGAGITAKKQKERMYMDVRCKELMDTGDYCFFANAHENFGAVDKDYKGIMHDWLKMICSNQNEGTKNKLCIMKNNFWIRFSINWMKMMVKRVKDHYPI